MRRRTNIHIFLLMYLLLSLAACAGGQSGMKAPSEMSPKEIAIWADKVYVAEYDGYKVEAARTDLTEDEKIFLRQKKRILLQLHPLLLTYNAYIDSGVLPEQQTTNAILGLVYRLTGGM